MPSIALTATAADRTSIEFFMVGPNRYSFQQRNLSLTLPISENPVASYSRIPTEYGQVLQKDLMA
jgi:hypothetical protein